MKSGAQAWKSAARPESMLVSPQASSQNGTTELSEPDEDQRHGGGAQLAPSARAASRDERRSATSVAPPSTQPPGDERRRLELPHADLDEHERRPPDRREREQHQDLAAAHGLGDNVSTRPVGFPD